MDNDGKGNMAKLKKIVYSLQTTVYRFAPLMKQKKNLFILAAIFWVLIVTIPFLIDVYGQGPPPSGGPPQVDIFAETSGSNAILVTWENPDDVAEDIVFRYTVSRSLNDDGNFVELFSSLRDLEERVVLPNGNEVFFFLDENVSPGNCYVYQVSAGAIQGNPNPVLSDDTRCIKVRQQSAITLVSGGNLIVSTTAPTPQPPLFLGFIKFFLPDIFAQAQNPILTTSLNPQAEPWLLALTPIPSPTYSSDSCFQILEILHQSNQDMGQRIGITITIIEGGVPKQQGTIGTSDSTKRLFARDLFIPFPDQTINNFTDLQIQLDFNAESASAPDHRSMSIWEVNFYVPEDNGAC